MRLRTDCVCRSVNGRGTIELTTVSKKSKEETLNRRDAIRAIGGALLASRWATGTTKSKLQEANGGSGIARGTINVILGNENGLVVLTDSMLSVRAPDGTWKQLQKPGRKLFRLDSTCVCTLAGFTEAPIPFTELEHTVPSVLQQYSEQLAHNAEDSPYRSNVTEKLGQLNFILANEISLLADIRNIPAEASAYEFQLTLAGYDPDGNARIAWSTLKIDPSGESDWLVSVSEVGEKVVSGPRLTSKIRGINGLAQKIVDHPEPYAANAAISKYRLSQDSGQPLTSAEMKAFAQVLAHKTALVYPAVGKEDQIAVLERGSIVEWDQAPFPSETYRTRRFNIVADNIYDPSPPPNLIGPVSGVTNLYVHNHFRGKNVLLDDSCFAANTFRDCVVVYRGGRTNFASNQDMSSSTLALSSKEVKRDSKTAAQLIKDFHWAKITTVEATRIATKP